MRYLDRGMLGSPRARLTRPNVFRHLQSCTGLVFFRHLHVLYRYRSAAMNPRGCAEYFLHADLKSVWEICRSNCAAIRVEISRVQRVSHPPLKYRHQNNPPAKYSVLLCVKHRRGNLPGGLSFGDANAANVNCRYSGLEILSMLDSSHAKGLNGL